VSLRAGRLALAIAAIALLATAPVAGAARVNWNEKAKYAGKPIMSYQVASLTFTKKGWTAVVSFRNLSHKTIKVGNRFAIGFWTKAHATDLSKAVGFGYATQFSSKVPTVLKPGDHWSGEIGGSSSLTRSGRVYARVIFGPFTGFPGQASSVVWITDHAQSLIATKVAKAKPNKTTTTTTTSSVPGPVM
jgi:hypothetical protein